MPTANGESVFYNINQQFKNVNKFVVNEKSSKIGSRVQTLPYIISFLTESLCWSM